MRLLLLAPPGGRHEAVGRARALGLLGPPAGAESGRAAEDSGTSGLAARLM